MKALIAAAALLASLTGLQSCAPSGTAAPAELGAAETGEVVAVVDGDTIDVQTPEGESRVRIIGVDTPEIHRDGTPDDCYAQEARTELDELAYRQTVELRTDPTQDETDRYGRELRHVYIDGQSIALTLIESGAGHEYTYDQPYIGQAEHQAAEREARDSRRGLWGSCAK